MNRSCWRCWNTALNNSALILFLDLLNCFLHRGIGGCCRCLFCFHRCIGVYQMLQMCRRWLASGRRFACLLRFFFWLLLSSCERFNNKLRRPFCRGFQRCRIRLCWQRWWCFLGHALSLNSFLLLLLDLLGNSLYNIVNCFIACFFRLSLLRRSFGDQ